MTKRELMNDRKREEDEPKAVTVLERYLTLKAQAKDIDEQIKAMQGEVIDIVTDEDGSKVIDLLGHDFGTQQRQTWEYSPDLQQWDRELKAAQKLEQARGVAQVKSTSVSVVVTRSKGPR